MSSGEILQLKDTINTMVDELNAVRGRSYPSGARSRNRGQTRRGQAEVKGVAGTWKDLTDSVNSMASDTRPDEGGNIAEVATAVARGDLSKKITVNVSGGNSPTEGDTSIRWSIN